MRTAAFVAAATALSFGLAACAGDTETVNDTAVDVVELATDTPAADSRVEQAVWDLPFGEPASLDPIKSFNYPENTVVSNMCEGLMRVTPDYSVEPGLAQSMESPDAKTWIYTLRDGVTFWDGKPMTTEDVVFSLRRHLDPDEGSYWASGSVTGNIASVEATGDNEVTIKLKRPDVTFNNYMVTPVGVVVQKAYRQQKGRSFGTPQGGVMCTGPYQLGSWDKGSKITLQSYDGYWDPELTPMTQTLVLQFIVDPGALASALQTGSVGGAYDVPLGAVPDLSESPDGTLYLGKSLQIVAVIPTGQGALADPAVRKALTLATDREAIAELIFNGTASAPRSLVPEGGWSYGTDTFDAAYQDLPAPTKDVAAAQELMNDVTPASDTITIAYPAERQFYADIISELANGGRELGLTVEPSAVPGAQYGAFFSDPKAREGYDAFMTTNYMDVPDPLAFLRTIAGQGGSQNYSGYDNPEVDALLQEAEATEDDTERAQLVAQIQQIVTDDAVWIPIAAPAVRLYLNEGLTGVPASFVYLYYPWAATLGGP